MKNEFCNTFPPKADMDRSGCDVHFAPKADIGRFFQLREYFV